MHIIPVNNFMMPVGHSCLKIRPYLSQQYYSYAVNISLIAKVGVTFQNTFSPCVETLHFAKPLHLFDDYTHAALPNN